jgi:hypothetical protein
MYAYDVYELLLVPFVNVIVGILQLKLARLWQCIAVTEPESLLSTYSYRYHKPVYMTGWERLFILVFNLSPYRQSFLCSHGHCYKIHFAMIWLENYTAIQLNATSIAEHVFFR